MIAADVHSYRDLIAWQKAMDVVAMVYEQTCFLPPDERYGLCSQMRRSAVSIASNIAEGWGGNFGQEYVRFLRIARGSTFELETQVQICTRLDLPGDWTGVVVLCNEVGRIINGLITSVQRTIDKRDECRSPEP